MERRKERTRKNESGKEAEQEKKKEERKGGEEEGTKKGKQNRRREGKEVSEECLVSAVKFSAAHPRNSHFSDIFFNLRFNSPSS